MAFSPEQSQPSAVRQIQQSTGGVISTLTMNPIEALKWQLSGGGLAVTSAVASITGELFLTPWMFTPSIFFRDAILKTATGFTKSAAWGQAITGALGGGISLGGAHNFGLVNTLGKHHDKVVMKAMRQAVRSTRWMATGADGFKQVMGKMRTEIAAKSSLKSADTIFKLLTNSPSASKVINTSLFMSRMGTILFPVVTALTLGHAVGRTMELGYKAAVSALDYSSAKYEQIRALEFGGTLGAGYKSQEAATERQRAVQALQRTHLAGRNALGHEAMNYAALV